MTSLWFGMLIITLLLLEFGFNVRIITLVRL